MTIFKPLKWCKEADGDVTSIPKGLSFVYHITKAKKGKELLIFENNFERVYRSVVVTNLQQAKKLAYNHYYDVLQKFLK